MTRLALIAAAGLILAGCGGGHTSTHPRPPHYPVVVHSPTVMPAPRLGLGDLPRFVSPTRLAIVTMGSSSCPSVPDEMVVLNKHTIRLHLTVGSWVDGKLVAKSPEACTLDYGPTPMLVAIDPRLVDVHRSLTVRLFYGESKKPVVRTVAPL